MSELDMLLRAAFAAGLGFVLGRELERCGSPAGDRTYALVGLGAATLVRLGVELYRAETARLVAGPVTGVGFLGAGIIMRSASGEVRGLTTAAGMWATAVVGVVQHGFDPPGRVPRCARSRRGPRVADCPEAASN